MMTKNNEDADLQGVGDKFSDVIDHEGHGESDYKDNAEEIREQHLQSRNEEAKTTGSTDDDVTKSNLVGEGSGPPDQGAHVVVIEPNGTHAGTICDHNRANSLERYFSKKMEKVQQERETWEQIGDEDLIGNARWFCGMKRIFWNGSLDSQGCPTASSVEVKEIFHHCILILGAYGDDMEGLAKAIQEHDPNFNLSGVVKFDHPKGLGACPPYFIYVDHEHREVSMYIRGLNLVHHEDYISLMNNRRGEKPWDGGYVHHGMSGPAEWGIEHAGPVLKEHLLANDGYRLTIVGHSLGAGVAALLTLLLVKDPEILGGISAERIRAIIFAPPRVMSLDLAIKYAPYINSIIYQDDFLPRVSTQSVRRLFFLTFAFTESYPWKTSETHQCEEAPNLWQESPLSLPTGVQDVIPGVHATSDVHLSLRPLTGAIVFIFWVKQAVQTKYLEDTQRLYPPGKIYHFVYKQPGRPGHRPIRARVVPNPKGRFERLVLSASATTNNHFVLTLAKHLKTYNWPEELKDPWLSAVLKTRR